MPHDKNGALVKVGDYVRVRNAFYGPGNHIGKVVRVHEGSTSCNLEVALIAQTVMASTVSAAASETEIVPNE